MSTNELARWLQVQDLAFEATGAALELRESIAVQRRFLEQRSLAGTVAENELLATKIGQLLAHTRGLVLLSEQRRQAIQAERRAGLRIVARNETADLVRQPGPPLLPAA